MDTGLEVLPPPTFSYASDEVSRIGQPECGTLNANFHPGVRLRK